MLVVDFALVTEETAGVGEALEFRTFGMLASIWSIVLIHVFAVEMLDMKTFISGIFGV